MQSVNRREEEMLERILYETDLLLTECSEQLSQYSWFLDTCCKVVLCMLPVVLIGTMMYTFVCWAAEELQDSESLLRLTALFLLYLGAYILQWLSDFTSLVSPIRLYRILRGKYRRFCRRRLRMKK